MKKTLQWKMSKWLEQALHRSRYPNGLYAYEKELNLVMFDSLQSNDPADFSRSGSSLYEDSPAKNTGMICHVLFQGIFPTQELNFQIQGSNLCLLHCRQILYHLGHQGSQKKKKWLILGNLRILLTDSDVFIFHFVFYLCPSSSLKYKPLKRRSACMRYENSFDYSYFCER